MLFIYTLNYNKIKQKLIFPNKKFDLFITLHIIYEIVFLLKININHVKEKLYRKS